MTNQKQSRDPDDGFYLNQCWVSISDNHLYFDQCAIKLEPKVIQVLQCLSENRDKVVSKAQLIEEVWKERVVADDSLVRCISVLRKHFKNNQVLGLKIDTVAKKGYRLSLIQTASTDDTYRSKTGDSSNVGASPRSRKLSFLLISLFLLVGIIFYWSYFEGGSPVANNDSSDYKRTVLLTSAEKERYPELSLDGVWLTFAKSTETGMAIYVKSLQDLGLQQITNGKFYDHQPTFSPDARQIVFARITSANQCEIRLISIIGGTDKKIADCRQQGVYSMAWSEVNHSVYFIDKTSSIDQGKLNRLDLTTGRIEEIRMTKPMALSTSTFKTQTSKYGQSGITRDNADLLGVDDVAISHDGRTIAITHSPALGIEDIYTSPLRQQKYYWTRLSHDNTKIHGLAFSADDKELFYSSNRTGTFNLWRADLEDWKPELVSQGVPNISEISTNPAGQIALERWTESSSINRVDAEGSSGKIVSAKNVNWSAVQSPNNDSFVFLSNRSGFSELWLSSNAREQQLTQLNGPWLMSPSWSADGRFIAFSTNQINGNRLHLYDLEKHTIEEIANTENSMAPYWHPSEMQLYFSKMNNGVSEVWSWSYLTKKLSRFNQLEAKAIKFSKDGRMYFTKTNQTGIWTIDENNQVSQIIDSLQLLDWNNWAPSKGTIYYIHRNPETGASILQMDIESGEIIAENSVPRFLYFSGLAENTQQNEIWYSQIESEDTDIDFLVPMP